MKRLLRRTAAAYLLLIAFLLGLGFFLVSYARDGAAWALDSANRHIYDGGTLVTTGQITDRTGEILAQSVDGQRKYSEDSTTRRALLHLIGDSEGFITNSVQKIYGAKLAGYSMLAGVHNLKDYNMTGSIQLTVSAKVCRTALEQLGSRKGAVSVYNYKTGEVLCMVSTPTFDPENKPDIDLNEDRYDGIYVNRVLRGLYAPGSTFKLVVAAAALENIDDIQSREFTCDGKYVASDGEIICNGKHGTLTFGEALAESCNTVFSQIAIELGPEILTAQAEKMGFNQNFKADGFSYSGGQFHVENATQSELGWAGIGQYNDMASPFNMMMIAGGIAAGGNAVVPRIIQTSNSPLGLPTTVRLWTNTRSVMAADTACVLADMMRDAAVHSFGSSFMSEYGLCCKTGTAEIQTGEQPHSWLVGFLSDETAPLAFAIVVENGGSASSTTRSIAQRVLTVAADEVRKGE